MRIEENSFRRQNRQYSRQKIDANTDQKEKLVISSQL